MNKIDVHVHAAVNAHPMHMPDAHNAQDNYIADPSELRDHLQAQGIGHAILLSGGESATMGAGNEDCRQMAAGSQGFFGWMCNLDPGDPAAVEGKLAAWQAEGAVGVGELSINEWMDSPFLTAVFAAAEKLHLPVTIHMSPQPGYAYGVCDRPGLPLLEETLKKFPDLILLGHSQMFWLEISGDCPRQGNAERTMRGHGAVVPGGRVPELFARYPNLYGDLSAGSGSCAILRDEEFGLSFLERYADRLLFATDTANRHQMFPLGAFLDQAYAAGRLSEAAYRKICRENAQRIFGV